MLRCLLVAALAAPPASATPPGPTPAPGPAPLSTSAVSSDATAPTTPAPATPVATTTPSVPPPVVVIDAGPSSPRGTLELVSTRPEVGPVSVRDSKGELVASVQLQPGVQMRLELPPGEYAIDDTARGGRITLSVEPEGRARFELSPAGARGSTGEVPPSLGPQEPADPPQPAPKRWKRIAAPLLSAAVPGVGQMVNRQPGKGVGILLGTVALALGAGLLHRTSGGTDVSSRGLAGGSFGTEAIGAVGYGLLSGGLQMLYASQIMEAYATASGLRSPEPRTRHRVALELTRMATVGQRPGDPAAGFFADWSLSLLGQVARRFSIGASDLSVKQGQGFTRTTLQGGVRLQYRFLDRGRVWLGVGAGVILQGSFGRPSTPLVPSTAPTPGGQGSFAAIPYAQLDLRYFILHRWSLNLTPRISAPIGGPRFYSGPGLPGMGGPDDRAVARNAVTLELGTGVGVYF